MAEVLYTVKEVAKMIRTNPSYVYKLIEAKRITVLKLGSLKIRESSFKKFLEESTGKDLTDPFNVKELSANDIVGEVDDRAC